MLQTLRAIAFVILIVGGLFKIQHWPGAQVFLLVAWGLPFIVMVARPLLGKATMQREAARDVFFFCLLSVMLMRLMHLPGRGFALGALVLAGLGVLWYDRDRILPGKGDADTKPWLFYLAVALILVGIVFRIQHWPYDTVVLLVGLALAAFWFFASKDSEQKQ